MHSCDVFHFGGIHIKKTQTNFEKKKKDPKGLLYLPDKHNQHSTEITTITAAYYFCIQNLVCGKHCSASGGIKWNM